MSFNHGHFNASTKFNIKGSFKQFKSISATVDATGTVIRKTGKIVNATVDATASVLRKTGKIISVQADVTATIVRKISKITSNAPVNVTASVVRKTSRIMSTTVDATATVVRLSFIGRLFRIIIDSTITRVVLTNLRTIINITSSDKVDDE